MDRKSQTDQLLIQSKEMGKIIFLSCLGTPKTLFREGKNNVDGLSPTHLKPPPPPTLNVDYVFFLTIVLSFFSNF